jgi:hypothetical protein
MTPLSTPKTALIRTVLFLPACCLATTHQGSPYPHTLVYFHLFLLEYFWQLSAFDHGRFRTILFHLMTTGVRHYYLLHYGGGGSPIFCIIFSAFFLRTLLSSLSCRKGEFCAISWKKDDRRARFSPSTLFFCTLLVPFCGHSILFTCLCSPRQCQLVANLHSL